MKLEFLELDDVLAIHAASIRRFGGATGLRDSALLESALAMPRATMFGDLLHPTIHEQAAAYLFHLVKNHPFVDGNKRVQHLVLVRRRAGGERGQGRRVVLRRLTPQASVWPLTLTLSPLPGERELCCAHFGGP
jgi:hypothetical protein